MTIDTLAYAKKLEEAGEERKIAHVHAHALKEAIEDNTVSQDYLHAELDRTFAKYSVMIIAEISSSETRMVDRLSDIHTKLAGMDGKITALTWITGFILVTLGVMATAIIGIHT